MSFTISGCTLSERFYYSTTTTTPKKHLAQCSLETGRALKGMTTQPMGPYMTQYPHHLPVSCHTKLICNTDTELSLRKSMGRMHLNSFRQYVSAYIMSYLFIQKGIFSLISYLCQKCNLKYRRVQSAHCKKSSSIFPVVVNLSA